MPETIRAENERLRSRPRRGGFPASALALLLAGAPAALPMPALAAPVFIDASLAALTSLTRQEISALALTLGLLCFAVVTAILLVRTRARAGAAETATRDEA